MPFAMKSRIGLLVLLAVLALGFFAFDLDRLLTLESLKAAQAELATWRATAPYVAEFGFFLLYVFVAALSLPGAAIMTLAAGAIFGLVTGTVIASFAASVGATLAMLAARYVLRASVQQRFGARLQAVNEGFARDGAFYLLTMRLLPVFPFFVINVLMGLVPVRVRTFYWVSQLGMLPATTVYVYTGTELASVSSVGDIFSPALLLAFALLALLPLLAKAFVGLLRRRRLYRRWQRPARFDRNLIVIGAGAAGLVSAYIAAAVKARVTLVESHKMGGDCLNYGCVPSKALIKSARVAHMMRHADRYGLEAMTPRFRFRTVMQRVHAIIARIEPHDSVERYTGLGVEVLAGHARIRDPWTVEIALNDGGTSLLTTRSIVIAAGAQPYVPPLPGLYEIGYVTSDTLWEAFACLEKPPSRLVVLGGGPIGCELAQAFARLGSEVSQVERADRIMNREDEEVSAFARDALEQDGVSVLTAHEALRCELDGGRKFLVVRHDGDERRIEFDAVICAVGRVARLRGYGLEELGIPVERTVVTNEYLQTLFPNILAAGDVAGPYQFTHTAAHQAWYAAVNALFGDLKRFKANYAAVPWTTFIDPEVARVGLNEQEAKARGVPYEVTRYDLGDLDRAIADGAARGFVKVLTVPGKDRLLGATIVGEHAGELLAEFVFAMQQGLGLSRILGTIHTYPTFSEAGKYAAGEWKRTHAPAWALALLERFHAWRLQ